MAHSNIVHPLEVSSDCPGHVGKPDVLYLVVTMEIAVRLTQLIVVVSRPELHTVEHAHELTWWGAGGMTSSRVACGM